MLRSFLVRGVSAGALAFAFTSCAIAQQSLPTIDIGGQRRSSAKPVASSSARTGAPTTAPSSRVVTQPATPTPTPPPLVASPFPSEPKTPEAGYVVRNASTGTKTDIPIRQTPVSVQVIPRQVIRDQNVTTLQDAIDNVPGVRSHNNDLEGYTFNIRGFRSNYIFRNNLALSESNPGGYDTANIERIEVLKGPSSILYGRAQPGGLINIITKQPLDAPLYRLEQQVGSFDHYRTEWDVSTPVTQVPGLAYRVSGAYQNSGSFRRFQAGERVLIAPVVSYRPTAWTEFTLDTQYFGQRQQSDTGFPVYVAQPFPIPLSRSFQEPNDPRDRVDSYNIGYTFRQNLTEDWKVTNRFLYASNNLDKLNIVGSCDDLTFCVGGDGRTLSRSTQYQFLGGRTFSTNIDLEGKFTALGGKHIFLMGLDYLNTYYDYYIGGGAGVYLIDAYFPVYGTVPAVGFLDARIGSGFKFHSSVLQRQKGFYVQDHVTWFDRLHLLLGTRYDVADNVSGSSSGGFQCVEFDPLTGECISEAPLYDATKDLAIANRLQARKLVDTAWSPRAGVVYDVLPQLNAYGSYSRSFGINNGLSSTGQPFPAERGTQWEVGLKAEPLPGLTANLAFFQITKTGVLTRDFTSAFASKPAGVQRSRGIEFDMIGRIGERITLLANYAFIDAKVVADGPKNFADPYGFVGDSGLYLNHLDNVPRHSGKIFATYDFGENGLGLRVGGGVTASTKAWGDIQNTFLMPGWARLDAFASYATLVEGHKVTAQLNLKNINNVQYFSGTDVFYNASARFNLLPAPPFTAVGSIKFEW